MKIVLTLALLTALAGVYFTSMSSEAIELEDSLQESFLSFIQTFNKEYLEMSEMNLRFEVYKKNLDIVKLHNSKKTKTFTMGQNKFSDWTEEEFNSILGYKSSGRVKNGVLGSYIPKSLPNSDDVKDWRNFDAVTPVKDQGKCGSCWAFSAIAAMEALNKFWNRYLIGFSEQQLVDCCRIGTSQGCNGGEMIDAFKYYAQGPDPKKRAPTTTVLESEYPYTGKDGLCNKDIILTSKSEIDGISHYDNITYDKTG